MTTFDTARFASSVKKKRGRQGLREVANQMNGISLATLSRIENAHTVDLQTALRVCDWLKVPITAFISEGATHHPIVPVHERIELLLRSETYLSDEAIDAVMTLIKALDTLSRKDRK